MSPHLMHAAVRRQQRAIPAFIIEVLETCGSERRCNGAEKLIFDKAARKRLKHYLGGERGLRTGSFSSLIFDGGFGIPAVADV